MQAKMFMTPGQRSTLSSRLFFGMSYGHFRAVTSQHIISPSILCNFLKLVTVVIHYVGGHLCAHVYASTSVYVYIASTV